MHVNRKGILCVNSDLLPVLLLRFCVYTKDGWTEPIPMTVVEQQHPHQTSGNLCFVWAKDKMHYFTIFLLPVRRCVWGGGGEGGGKGGGRVGGRGGGNSK